MLFLLTSLLLSLAPSVTSSHTPPFPVPLTRSPLCPVILQPDNPFESRRILVSTNVSKTQSDPRVINGDIAADGLRPYLVSLFLISGSETGFCTGALISPRFVITAAHCEVDGNTRVRIAVQRALGIEQDFTAVEAFAIHKNFRSIQDSERRPFDIAVIRLAEDAPTGAKFMRVNVNPQLPLEGSIVRAVGYGTTTGDGDEPSNAQGLLRQVDIPVKSNDKCEETFDGIDSNLQLCAGYERGSCGTWYVYKLFFCLRFQCSILSVLYCKPTFLLTFSLCEQFWRQRRTYYSVRRKRRTSSCRSYFVWRSPVCPAKISRCVCANLWFRAMA